MGHPITPEGLIALKKEVEYLRQVKRPEIIRAISEAREHGDLKENAEYHSAKEDQALLEARIAQLETAINLSEVIDVSSIKQDGRAVFGTTVTLLNLDTNQNMKIHIVGELETDLKNNKVSFNAPLVKAFVGKSKGDSFEFVRNGESIWYEIIDVEYI